MKAINKKTFVINLLGVVMSGAMIYSMNPVAIAYFTAAYVEKNLRYVLFLSTVVGLVLWMPLTQAIQYGLILTFFVCIFMWVEKRQGKKRVRPIVYSSISAVITLGIGMGAVVQRGWKQQDMILLVIESVLIVVLSQIFLKGMVYLKRAKKGQLPNNEELISIILLFAILVYAIPDVSGMEFSFKETIAYLIILILGYKFGAGAGAICGAAFGFVLYVEGGVESILGVMCILGISAGVFRKVGKFGTGVAFLLCNIVLGYFYEGSLIEVVAVRAIVSAIVVFLLLPKKVIRPLEVVSRPKEEVEVSNQMQEVTKSRLLEFSQSFKKLSKTFYQISETKTNLSKEDVDFIFDELSDKLCRNCINCATCWKSNFYDTYKAAFSILSSAEQNGEVRQEDIPASFAKQCLNLNDFLYETNRGLEMAKLNLTWHNRMAQSREAIAGQLGEVANIIQDFSSELYESVSVQQHVKDDIIYRMKQIGVEVKHVSVVGKKNKRQEYYLSARSMNGRCITSKEAAKYLEEVVGTKMKPVDGTKTVIAKEFGTYLFVEDTKFKVLTGIAKATKSNEVVSGDNFSFVHLDNGEMLMTLSDGMGAGEQAYVESQSVVELLEQFMEAGFKEESAIKLINSILVLRTDQQICSTIDMSVIDLFTGVCDFIKIGAAATFIKRENCVETITSTSLPIGVFNQVDIDDVSKKLYDGDIIVMVTDGVLDCVEEEDKEKVLATYIAGIKSTNSQDIADSLLAMAMERQEQEPMDDMTILVASIWKKS